MRSRAMPSKVVYKYALTSWTVFREVPRGACVLSAGVQGDSVVVWLLVDPDERPVSRALAYFATGYELSDLFEDAQFVGTVQLANGLVWHVFDGGETDGA